MSTRLRIMTIYIAPLQMLLFRIAPEYSTAERRLGEHKMSQGVPWGTSAVPKRVHYRVKSQPLWGRPQSGRLVKCGHLRTRGYVCKVVLFIIPVRAGRAAAD